MKGTRRSEVRLEIPGGHPQERGEARNPRRAPAEVKKVTRRDTRRGGQERKENNLDHRREVRTPEKGVASVVRKEIDHRGR